MLQPPHKLKSYANTTVLSKSCLLIQDFDRTISISGWDATADGAKDCPTVTGVVAYNHPYTGQTYVNLASSYLLGDDGEPPYLPFAVQSLESGVTIHDSPKIFVTNPTNQSHATVINADPYTPEDKLIIPLQD